MIIQEYFKTPIWVEEKLEWLDELINKTNPYIEKAKKSNQQKIKNNKNSDFGIVHHSESITNDTSFKDFFTHIAEKSFNFLDWCGYDLKNYDLIFNDTWVQEFPKDGGGYHNTHIHSNNHVSGFYYLVCTNKSSFPVFHDPRPAHIMNYLPEKNIDNITNASIATHWKVNPGTLIITPAYLPHEYAIQKNDPFRFIHFNLQAIRRN